jgi:Carbohydrate esterase, sialic acid-specific acetylesterase
MNRRNQFSIWLVIAMFLVQRTHSAAEISKPVKVFILMGQSNMVGMGHIHGDKGESLEQAVKTEKRYPYLLDADGNWAKSKTVRNVQVMVGRGGMNVLHNEWMQVGASVGKGNATMGVEFGLGHQLSDSSSEPVMLLKSCIGNRSLGWDLLPPDSKGFDFTTKDRKTGKEVTYTYAGYKESPMRWEKGTPPEKVNWYAGKQYDDDVVNAKKVLAELDKYYPGAKSYEVAGFFWWQGEKDCGDEALASHYEENLVCLIKSLRKDFNAPNAKFVLATLGEATPDIGGNEQKVFDAQLAVDGNSGKHPEFKGNMVTVFTHPMARGGSGNGHYGGNAKVYMDVGEAMGKAMVDLLENRQ